MPSCGIRFLLALFSAVLAAASSESCAVDSVGLCGTLPVGEHSSIADPEDAQLDEEYALEADVTLLQTNLQHPHHQRVEALAHVLAGQAMDKDESQLGVAVGASAEAARSGNISEPAFVERQASASSSAASASALSVAVAVAASAAAEQAEPGQQAMVAVEANRTQAAAARATRPSAAATAATAPAERPRAVAAAAAASAPKPAQAKAEALPPPAAEPLAVLAKSLALTERQSGSAANAWPSFGDILQSVGDLGTSAAEKALDSVASGVAEAAVAAFASVINSTLSMLDEKADELVAYCSSYKDAILLNVSQSGDRKIEQLQGIVVSHLGQVQERWGIVVDTLAQAGPPLVSATSTLGLESLSNEVQAGVDRTLEIADRITDAIANASQIVARMGGRSQRDLQAILQELNATISAGLEATSALADEAARLVQRAVSGAAGKLGISLQPASMLSSPDGVQSTLQALVQQAEDTINKVSAGISDYLSGTLEAAEIALAPVGGGGARGVQAMSILVMVAVLLLGTVVH